MMSAGNILMIGMPGVGKSSVGRLVSYGTGRGYLDLDHWIVRGKKQSPADVINKEGIEAWRRYEVLALKRLRQVKRMVIAVGGGCVHAETAETLQQLGTVVHLDCAASELVRRLSSPEEVKKRPLLTDALDESGNVRIENLETLLRGLKSDRRELFEKVADITVPTDYLSSDVCAQWLISVLKSEENKEGKSSLWSHLKASY